MNLTDHPYLNQIAHHFNQEAANGAKEVFVAFLKVSSIADTQGWNKAEMLKFCDMLIAGFCQFRYDIALEDYDGPEDKDVS